MDNGSDTVSNSTAVRAGVIVWAAVSKSTPHPRSLQSMRLERRKCLSIQRGGRLWGSAGIAKTKMNAAAAYSGQPHRSHTTGRVGGRNNTFCPVPRPLRHQDCAEDQVGNMGHGGGPDGPAFQEQGTRDEAEEGKSNSKPGDGNHIQSNPMCASYHERTLRFVTNTGPLKELRGGSRRGGRGRHRCNVG